MSIDEYDKKEKNSNDFTAENCYKKCGLTSKEASERIRKGLSNKQSEYEKYAYLKIISRNVFTYFNFIFVAFAVALISQKAYNNLMFMGVVISNSVIGIVQEIRSKKELDKLNIVSKAQYSVIRDGVKTKIKSDLLVKDDVAEFEAGEQIPADAEIISGDVSVNESYITGETDEVKKHTGDTLYSGSFVVSGKCRAYLTAVGNESFASLITEQAKKLKKNSRPGMMKSLNILITVIGILIIPFSIIMFVNQHYTLALNVKQSVENTVASSIGMIPEGLYLLTSAALFASTVRLAQKKTLVHDMKCIESLARVDVLCVDKTGTITKPNMSVEDIVTINSDKNHSDVFKDFIYGFDTSNAVISALKDYYGDWRVHKRIFKKTEFSSTLKYSAVMFDGEEAYLMGAPEILLKNNLSEYNDTISSYTNEGKRVLLFACTNDKKTVSRIFSGKSITSAEITPLMFIVLSNPVRKNAKKTFEYFEKQGVSVKVISGDNPQTVSYTAKQAGIKNADKYIDVSNLSDKELCTDKVLQNTVFGRVSPAQKKVIVCAIKAQKHTVAMTGDGVNDVLALKEADCSIAMASGAEAASNVSDLVLVNSDFANMPLIVNEGRRVINNIERAASLFLVKNIFSFIMTLVSVFAVCYYPLKPVQISIVSAMMIGMPSFILALEPNNSLVKGKFLINVVKKALPSALSAVLSICCLLIISDYFKITYNTLSTMACIIYGFCSYMMLYRVCKPFKITHIILFVAAGLGYGICALSFPNFFFMYRLNKGSIVICILLAVFAWFIQKMLNVFLNFVETKSDILRNVSV